VPEIMKIGECFGGAIKKNISGLLFRHVRCVFLPRVSGSILKEAPFHQRKWRRQRLSSRSLSRDPMTSCTAGSPSSTNPACPQRKQKAFF